MSGDSLKHFNQISQNPDLLNNLNLLRRALLDFIADFANWDNSTKQEYLDTCRTLTQVAYESLGGIPGNKPLVADPFAGGGAIPLEALRVGADAFASDLNPVAVLLNKVVLEYIPKYGNARIEMQGAEGKPVVFNGIAEAVRYWGRWIKQEAVKNLSRFYPNDPDGATPIAYLWARSVISEAPDDGTGIPIEVPLIRSLWLCKKDKKLIALKWVRDAHGKVQMETLQVTYANGETISVRRPLLEIFYPEKVSEVEPGTVARGSATCPVTGYTTPVASVRRQLKTRRGGASDARMLAVVNTRPGQKGRFYRLPNEADLAAILEAAAELERRVASQSGELSLVPDEPTKQYHSFVNRGPIYGLVAWSDYYQLRQQLSLAFLSHAISNLYVSETPASQAIKVFLAFSLSKQADLCNSMTRWKQDAECPVNLFARQAIPMVWDTAEVNVLSESSGGWQSMFERTAYSLEQLNFELMGNGQVEQFSATEHTLPNDSINVFCTDPPYYYSVQYADLSDFFYVWLKRCLKQDLPSIFRDILTPKDQEIIVQSPGHEKAATGKNKIHYEQNMKKAMGEGRRILSPDGIGVIVFAHKSTSGWEAQLQSMLEAGWVFTASWPIDTEMATRVIAQNRAVLASSVHLVCRPRENPDGSLITNHIGDWRDILTELPKRIHDWMPRLAEEGVVGADAIFACLGPALEIFSQYSSVEKASGEPVSLREYLEHVWAAVAKEALNMIFSGVDTSGFEEDARLTAMLLWTLNTAASVNTAASELGLDESEEAIEEDDDEDSGSAKATKGGFILEYDAARKIAQGLGAHLEQLEHLVEVKGSEARLLAVSERGAYLFGKKTPVVEQPKGKKAKAKSKQANIFELFESTDTNSGDALAKGFTADVITSELQVSMGKSVLDRIHQCMILFATGQSDTLRRFLVDEGIGRDERFWRLAQALSALYPQGTDEKRWVDGVLARKKGMGF
ncbi:MAG: hypothetical protein U1D69_04105 [Polynucleobacter sp.]|nr:hypothetical protein [Polynucleobacter sp.]